ncbi:cobalamin biosynthesis protein CbiX [Rhodobacteraceae bacterium D3-12]|nr:cobalamin biosynthesis protein CbiX [Rhodobacteraceae bacterium D3-12]
MQALAENVARLLPGWRVEGGTLAAREAFEALLDRSERPLVYPFFMARGWFTETHLVKRINGRAGRIIPPTGADPALPQMAARALETALRDNGWKAKDTALLLAAHGSRTAPASSESAWVTEQVLSHVLGFRTTRTGFIEQEPFLRDQAAGLGQAICLPFFALRAGHMLMDVPEALESAGFSGPVLPPLVEFPDLPAVIADSLRRHATGQPAAV